MQSGARLSCGKESGGQLLSEILPGDRRRGGAGRPVGSRSLAGRRRRLYYASEREDNSTPPPPPNEKIRRATVSIVDVVQSRQVPRRIYLFVVVVVVVVGFWENGSTSRLTGRLTPAFPDITLSGKLLSRTSASSW